MPKDEFYTPTDLDALRMENELLAFEVRFLRTRLNLPTEESGPRLASPVRLAYLEDAEKDLVLLVRRLSGSPLGRALRLNGNFRALERRYLRPTPAGSVAGPDRLEQLERAEADLKSLLRRLVSGPLGPAFRRRPAIVTLEQRYL